MNNQNKANGYNTLKITEKALLAASGIVIGKAAVELYKKHRPRVQQVEANAVISRQLENLTKANLYADGLDTIFRYSQDDLITIATSADSTNRIYQRKISKVTNNPDVEYVIVDRYLPTYDYTKLTLPDTAEGSYPQLFGSQYNINIYQPSKPNFQTVSDDREGVLICIAPDDATNPILAYNFIRHGDYIADALDADPEIMLDTACSAGYESHEIRNEVFIANHIREAFESIDVGSLI